MIYKFLVETNSKTSFIDITRKVEGYVLKSNLTEGLCTVFIPHTTAAVTINENADPDVLHDLTLGLDSIVDSKKIKFRHFEGNSDGHIKSSMFGVSETIIVKNNRLLLGTWQGIYLCEFDGPRTRSVYLKIS